MDTTNNGTSNQSLTMWKFLWDILKPYKWWCLLMVQAPLLAPFYELANNYSLKLLIDAFSNESNTGYAYLMYPVALFILAQIGLDISWRICNIAEWNTDPYARKTLLLRAYDYIQYHSYGFFQNISGGTIISKLKGIVDGYDYVIDIHHTIGRSLCMTLISIFTLLIVSTQLFFFMFAWCIVLVAVLYPLCSQLTKISNEYSESNHRIMGLFSDNITNIFSVFYFSKRKNELHRVEKVLSTDSVPRLIKLRKYDFKIAVIGGLLYSFMLLSIFLFMIYLRKYSTVSIGDFIFVMLSSITIACSVWELVFGLCNFVKEMGNFKSSFSLLARPHENVDSSSAQACGVLKGEIEFKDVSFSYDEKPIFSGLNLSIRAGEKVGIVGHSGSGKSTLISLLLKNFKPSSGDILVDKNSIAEITTDSLRKNIALIPQDSMLFHRSIAENIGYAVEDPSLDEIKQAAKQANIHDFIESLPEKYDTQVGERGVKISGGQRQRISIARALLKNAPIVILDEATASLDTITEQQIQESINSMLKKSNATVLAVAHRLSTIRHMDRIIVMSGGKIIEEGTFDQLIVQQGGYFKKLWESQTGS